MYRGACYFAMLVAASAPARAFEASAPLRLNAESPHLPTPLSPSSSTRKCTKTNDACASSAAKALDPCSDLGVVPWARSRGATRRASTAVPWTPTSA